MSFVVWSVLACITGCHEVEPSSDVEVKRSELSTATGSMADARVYFTGTRLGDGRVLVVGGNNNLLQPPRAKAELYNPATGTWSATGQLADGRYGHTATLLSDGKVLVVAGKNDLPTVSNELYDPATGTWTTVGSDVSRYFAAAVALADGRVLMSGGVDESGYSLASARIIDPVGGNGSTVPPMTAARYGHSATLLSDGKVLVAGGTDSSGTQLFSAELFDPSTGTWSSAGNMYAAHSNHTATRLADGRVLIAGGLGGGTTTSATELYEPSTNTWSLAGSLSLARTQHRAYVTPSGEVVVLGGIDSGGGPTPSAERFNPTTATWSPASPLTVARSGFVAVPLDGGQVLVAGGHDGSNPLATAELYTDTSSCVPTTCAAQGKTCGTVSDGCGGSLSCGTCPGDQTCSASNVCITPGAAVFDTTLRAPRCTEAGAVCDSGALLNGRGPLGPEPNHPNTLGGSCADGTSGTYHTDESLDRLRVSTVDGTPMATGKTVRVDATAWVYSASSNKVDLYYTGNANSPAWTFLATLTPTASGAQTLSATYTLPAVSSLQAVRGVFRYSGAASTCDTGSYNDRDDLVFPVSGPVDSAPPTVALTSPTAGATVSGMSVTLTATASDDVGVARVEFYDGTTLIGTVSTPPYTLTWNTRIVDNGTHTLTARAHDVAGRSTVSAGVAVTVANDKNPTVQMTSPAANSTVSGVITLAATASDDVGVARVEFQVDSTVIATLTAPPYTVSWNSATVLDGTHHLSARAYDTAGQTSAWGLNVTVRHDYTAPTTALTSPASGATVTGTVTLTASASDNQIVTRVEFYDGTTLLGTDTTSPYSLSWNTTTSTVGSHTLSTKAYDSAGNVGTSAGVTVTIPSNGPVLAQYDSTLRAPRCSISGSSCDSGSLLTGKGSGIEPNAPNTLGDACIENYYDTGLSVERVKVSSLDGGPITYGKTVQIEATIRASSSADRLEFYITSTPESPSWTYTGLSFSISTTGSQVKTGTITLPWASNIAIRTVLRASYSGTVCSNDWFAPDDRDDLVFRAYY
ncbi:Ig-like domain-containing protein [Archangium lansingense]|uniref:Ig-like domain-containing protein n=1 Tax=Archangium lansingense TaxID=2995310 RepID=UPI003B777DE3